MNLSISNIAWDEKNDLNMYEFMEKNNYTGLEIAPTRIITSEPYNDILKIKDFSEQIYNKHNLTISSMQSIWYGIKEKLFNSKEEYDFLMNYTKKAIDFAQMAKCKNIVFGCPQNRVINSEADINRAISFFEEIGEYALSKETIFSLEANPVIYGTNFINTTEEAFDLVDKLKTDGIMVNLDIGAMIYNDETLYKIEKNLEKVNHIHISEPNLNIIEKRTLHSDLAQMLKDGKYSNYISIEMKNQFDLEVIKDRMNYVNEVFK